MKNNFAYLFIPKLLVLPLVLVIISIACVTSGKLMTMNLSEKNLNMLIGTPGITLSESLEITVDNVDIQDEFIRIFVTVNQAGKSYSNGFFDLNLVISEGRIAVDIINTEFSGEELTGESKNLFTDFFEKELNRYVQKGSQRVVFEEINYVRDGIQIRFRIPIAPTPTIGK
jgi:hypothetical protein